jgi:hypothetical protein
MHFFALKALVIGVFRDDQFWAFSTDPWVPISSDSLGNLRRQCWLFKVPVSGKKELYQDQR